MITVPEQVVAARAAALAAQFPYSSDDVVGRLLSVLAAAVPSGGRILELGTGAGVGLAWLIHGLGRRTDVEVITVESVPAQAALAGNQSWPDFVTLLHDDAVSVLPSLGQFDLIFADAPGGKWDRLDLTVEALRPGGFLLVDDMTPEEWWEEEQREKQRQVSQALLSHAGLVSIEMEWSTGVILCVRKH